MAKYQCPDCQYIYDECRGEPHEGFKPSTTWDEIPENWACPDCAVRDKVDFKIIWDPQCELVQQESNYPGVKNENHAAEYILLDLKKTSPEPKNKAEKISLADELEVVTINQRQSQTQAVRRSSAKKKK